MGNFSSPQLGLGLYSVLLLLFPPSYVAFWDSKTPHRPSCERVSYCVEASPPSWLPHHDRSPFLTLLSLSFCLFILSCCLLKRMGCLSECQVSSDSVQKLFCGSCSTFKCSFDEFVGEKVISLSYSSVTLPFLLRELWPSLTYVRVEKNWKLISLVQCEVFESIGKSFFRKVAFGKTDTIRSCNFAISKVGRILVKQNYKDIRLKSDELVIAHLTSRGCSSACRRKI